MNAVLKRRLIRAQLEDPPRRGVPWWAYALLGLCALASLFMALGVGVIYAMYSSYSADYVPIVDKLRQRYVGLTEIYDRGGPADGILLGTLANPNAQLLNPVPLDHISNYLVQATISTEDNSFWDNPGVDPKALVRAAWENYSGGGVGSGTGGSSITQQLVKNVYLSDDCQIVEGVKSCSAPRTLRRKLKEIAFSLELEKNYTKPQILEWYFNQISYADRYVGVEAAAQGYFHKSASELTLAEAALLAGIPAAPTLYHPRLNCVRNDAGTCVLDGLGRTTVGGPAKERQTHVINLMVEHKRATPEEATEALQAEVKVFPSSNPILASAWIDDQVEPRLVRMCEAGILPLLPGATTCVDSVHSGGYRVTSTLDYAETEKARAMANTAVFNGLKAGCECHNAAIVTIDPPTGQVVVYAPNIDPTWVSDRRVAGDIDQLVEVNQPGSSFKPAVYLAWFDGLAKTPMSSIWDTSPMPLDKNVSIVDPRRDNGNEGLISARAALGGSQNVPAFRAAQETGVDNVIQMAKALGITTLDQQFDPTFYSHRDIYYGPSIATGGANVRVIDMAYMNATIANMGVMIGVPTLARTIGDVKTLHSLAGATGGAYDTAVQERLDFIHGHIRLPGTRALDPVVILEVAGVDGAVLYKHGDDLVKAPVVNAGSVWMLHSIMSDCSARFIIWGCGSSNDDLALDFFLDGVKIPGGIKTGTQQGFQSANDTLQTWMNGYSRYAATAVMVGNADKSLVRDGPSANYASGNTTIRLFKNWMAQYHMDLKSKGVFKTLANFDELRPANVKLGPFQSASTDRGLRGGCSQVVQTWIRTDIKYPGDCLGKGFMPLPAFKPELALALARQRGIATNGYAGGFAAPSPSPSADTPSATPEPTQPVPSATAPARTPPPATPSPKRPSATPTPAVATPTRPPLTPTAQSGNGNGNGR